MTPPSGKELARLLRLTRLVQRITRASQTAQEIVQANESQTLHHGQLPIEERSDS